MINILFLHGLWTYIAVVWKHYNYTTLNGHFIFGILISQQQNNLRYYRQRLIFGYSTIVYDKEICIRLYVKESYKYYQSRIEEGEKKGKWSLQKRRKEGWERQLKLLYPEKLGRNSLSENFQPGTLSKLKWYFP